MTKGVLLFALNGEFKYTDLAELTAKRIKKFLKLPVTVVVNNKYKNKGKLFDKIINIKDDQVQYRLLKDGGDSSQRVKWLNFTRADCYELSPYDETLVLDVDYLINSDHLSVCFDLGKDFLIFKDSFDLSDIRKLDEFDYINPFSVKFYWATVFYFKKTELNKIFFEFTRYVKDNWHYYCSLYQIKDKKFRNDFAFSIAIHSIFNHAVSDRFGFIPGKKFYSIDKDFLIKDVKGTLTFLLSNESNDKLQPASISNTDVHVMNKFSMLRVYNE